MHRPEDAWSSEQVSPLSGLFKHSPQLDGCSLDDGTISNESSERVACGGRAM